MYQDNDGNWIIHLDYNTIGTTSGRFTSKNPNAQNFPREASQPPKKCGKCATDMSEADTYKQDLSGSRFTCVHCGHVNKTHTYDLRKTLIPRKGYCFVSSDWSSMEIYLAALDSGDKNLIDLLRYKEADSSDIRGDMHSVTACNIQNLFSQNKIDIIEYGCQLNSDDKAIKSAAKDRRYSAKTVNFGVMYGISKYGLRAQLLVQGYDVSEDDCERMIEAFFIAYPGIETYFEE